MLVFSMLTHPISSSQWLRYPPPFPRSDFPPIHLLVLAQVLSCGMSLYVLYIIYLYNCRVRSDRQSWGSVVYSALREGVLWRMKFWEAGNGGGVMVSNSFSRGSRQKSGYLMWMQRWWWWCGCWSDSWHTSSRYRESSVPGDTAVCMAGYMDRHIRDTQADLSVRYTGRPIGEC